MFEPESPSPRRAWIEISIPRGATGAKGVALPTEGVDRNPWLEAITAAINVALPTEGVDRNQQGEVFGDARIRRPPHGGRG